jgi:hypothetical protein
MIVFNECIERRYSLECIQPLTFSGSPAAPKIQAEIPRSIWLKALEENPALPVEVVLSLP